MSRPRKGSARGRRVGADIKGVQGAAIVPRGRATTARSILRELVEDPAAAIERHGHEDVGLAIVDFRARLRVALARAA